MKQRGFNIAHGTDIALQLICLMLMRAVNQLHIEKCI